MRRGRSFQVGVRIAGAFIALAVGLFLAQVGRAYWVRWKASTQPSAAPKNAEQARPTGPPRPKPIVVTPHVSQAEAKGEVKVLDAATRAPVLAAKVTAELDGHREDVRTDMGVFRLPDLISREGQLRIEAAGYFLLGIQVASSVENPEHQLYLKLAEKNSDSAHSRYNALIRRLVSFERAYACAA